MNNAEETAMDGKFFPNTDLEHLKQTLKNTEMEMALNKKRL